MAGLVAELKVKDETYLGSLSQYVYSIALKALYQGRLVDQVVIYGITVSHGSDRSRLIQLQIDFEMGVCCFKACDGYFPLDMLLNVILAHI